MTYDYRGLGRSGDPREHGLLRRGVGEPVWNEMIEWFLTCTVPPQGAEAGA